MIYEQIWNELILYDFNDGFYDFYNLQVIRKKYYYIKSYTPVLFVLIEIVPFYEYNVSTASTMETK